MRKRYQSKEEIDAKASVAKMTTKEKVKHYLGYYKVHGLVAIFLLYLLGSFVYTRYINPPDDIILNTSIYMDYVSKEAIGKVQEELEQSVIFQEDGEDIEVRLITKASDIQAEAEVAVQLTAYIVAQDLDLMMLDKEDFEKFAYDGTFMSLDDLIEKGKIDVDDTRYLSVASREEGEHIFGIDVSEKYEDTFKTKDGVIIAIVVNTKRFEKALEGYKSLITYSETSVSKQSESDKKEKQVDNARTEKELNDVKIDQSTEKEEAAPSKKEVDKPVAEEKTELKATANIKKTELFPGEFFQVRVSNIKENQHVKLRTGLTEYNAKFFLDGQEQVVNLAVPMGQEAGSVNVDLLIYENEHLVDTLENQVEIIGREFEADYLYVTESTASKKSDDSYEILYKHLREARENSSKDLLIDGDFIYPVEARISSTFGKIRYVNDKLSNRHSGIDLAAPEGTPVKVCQNGIITLSMDLPVTGKTIILDHGQNIFTCYYHMSELIAEEGQTVKTGEIVGKVGTTGFSTGPHLHWGIWINATFTDPVAILENNPFEK